MDPLAMLYGPHFGNQFQSSKLHALIFLLSLTKWFWCILRRDLFCYLLQYKPWEKWTCENLFLKKITTKPKQHSNHLSFRELMNCVRCSLAWLELKPAASTSPQWLSLDTLAVRICIFWGLTKASVRTTHLSSVKRGHVVYISHPHPHLHLPWHLTFTCIHLIDSFIQSNLPVRQNPVQAQSCWGSWQWCERL